MLVRRREGCGPKHSPALPRPPASPFSLCCAALCPPLTPSYRLGSAPQQPGSPNPPASHRCSPPLSLWPLPALARPRLHAPLSPPACLLCLPPGAELLLKHTSLPIQLAIVVSRNKCNTFLAGSRGAVAQARDASIDRPEMPRAPVGSGRTCTCAAGRHSSSHTAIQLLGARPHIAPWLPASRPERTHACRQLAASSLSCFDRTAPPPTAGARPLISTPAA